jgi:hypothetical protein
VARRSDLKLSKRRIIDFLLAQLREHVHDAMRER